MKKGFTLVELLAVLGILGILMVIGGISVFGIVSRVREKSLEDGLNSLKEASVTYVMDKKIYLKSCSSDFDPQNPLLKSTNSGCYKSLTLNDLLNEKLFDKKSLRCTTSAKIIVYRYTSGNYNELRAYLEPNICTL